MTRFMRVAFAAIIATVAMGFATSSAMATGTVSVSTASTTATTGSITLRDSALANVIGAITLTISVRTGTIACDLTNGVTIGTVTGSRIVISSPAGYTATGIGTWPVTSRCTLSGGLIGLRIVPNFSITAGFLGTYTYTGTADVNLAAAGSSAAGTASAFTSNRSSTASFLTPWSFALSPAISWRLI